ncbi:MAG TPA: TetR/AcrR family transcriptional regulator [Solirubrobacteraceae bacterium]|jgi:AcrR family transcriptional regulator
MSSKPPPTRKSTQRERLIEGMIASANRNGYAGANVSQVIAHAGVSRPTFYDYFADKDDCFLAAHADISESLCEHIGVAVEQAPPAQAPQTAIRRLLQRAEEEPARAQFIATQAMAGGPRALDARDRTIVRIDEIIETARAGLGARTQTPDLPNLALIGATQLLLSNSLHNRERNLTTLADELAVWIESYDRPAGKHRWRTLEPGPSPGPSPYVSELPSEPPPPIPSGRTRLSSNEIAQNQRWRILFAAAEAAANRGYTATTVADIATVARVDKRVFYSHFRDKQEAFMAAHELGFQQTMTVGANAFFSAESWPERIWRGVHAASQFAATHPSIARVGYVEAHAIGPSAVQRRKDSVAAFTIFLQEGNQQNGQPQSQTAMDAIAAAISEVAYQQCRHGHPDQLPRMSYVVTYLALAPIIGPSAANRFIDGKL